VPGRTAGVFKSLSLTDRLLPVWIVGAMIVGVVLGYYTNIGVVLDTTKIATVSLPIAIGLWLMMWPVLCKVRYELLGEMFRGKGMWRQVAMSLVLNWMVGPLFMTGLAWATLPDLPGYRNGVILVGIARCIAMVLIWNQLARGGVEYCAVLVAINSVMQIVLYAPLALFYLKVVSQQSGANLNFGFWQVARSVLIFLGAPLVAGIVTRYGLIALKGRDWLDKKFLPWFGPLALLALVYTVLVLFALQGHRVIDEIGNVFRVAVPLVLYFACMWTGTVVIARRFNSSYEQAVTQSFTAASNNFELAIAIAVSTFGVDSEEALAATIGPLIEVPALLALVYVALWLHRKLAWPTGTF
jgi:ACR3 family arsenite transporter